MTTRPWHGGELRWDRLAGEWVVLAPRRANRPRHDRDGCPFCPGPGEDTPPERWRSPAAGDGAWRVRAVPNRYAVSDQHEVLIESPRHDWDLATGTEEEVAEVLAAWQTRHRAMSAGAAQVVVFRNHGHAAGISMTHPHSQIVGLPVVSAATRRELENAHDHHRRTGRRLGDDLLAAELSSGSRLVVANGHAVAYVPFAPASEFEIRVAPRTSRADFTRVPAGELADIAVTLRQVLAAVRAELADPAYSLIVHTAPAGWTTAPFLSWYVRIVPRLGVPAGLELATGIPVLSTTPEHAASRLRARLFAGSVVG